MRDAWGGTIRDGFGQTEMTACIGNSPGQAVKVGSYGSPPARIPGGAAGPPSPGEVVDAEGEISLRPVPASARAHGRVLRRPREDRRVPGRWLPPQPATSRCATTMATSPTSDAPMTCSRPPTTDLAVRARVRAAGARPRDRGGGDPEPRSDASGRAEGLRVPDLRCRSPPTRTRRARSSPTRTSGCRRTCGCGSLEFVPELPKTISGKIRRVELRAREAARVQSGDESGQHRDRDYYR